MEWVTPRNIDHDRHLRTESESLLLLPPHDITAVCYDRLYLHHHLTILRWALIFGPSVFHADQSIEQTPDGMHRDSIHDAVCVCSPGRTSVHHHRSSAWRPSKRGNRFMVDCRNAMCVGRFLLSNALAASFLGKIFNLILLK